ncbi:UNVERIFIED_CONTAM: hypothetical protein Sangu_2891900 [Sesamum angustifolium]|uniref:Uncharacterized protein n=1 Tax=Sesamum angustifolium TaxID=2727405 RepID=A0AAW2IMS5_9LAMI
MSCASTQMVSVWCGALVDGAGVVTQADDSAYTTQCWTYLWHTVRWCMMVDVRGYAEACVQVELTIRNCWTSSLDMCRAYGHKGVKRYFPS